MKNFFALISLSLVCQTLQADPVRAPADSTWVKIESLETYYNQISIQGYVEGSTVLSMGTIGFEESAKAHCLRAFYLMMEKPGKYTTKAQGGESCILRVAK